MASRQTLYNRKNSVKTLQALASRADLPLTVEYVETKFGHMAHFKVETVDGSSYVGRYQAVYAWICGYMTAKLGSHDIRFSNHTNQ